MYPPENYDNYNSYGGGYDGGYPPNGSDMARSMGGGGRPPPPPPRGNYHADNNPAVGPGEARFSMPIGPPTGGGGFGGFSGGPPAGPGGFVFDQPPGAGRGGYPPSNYNSCGGGGGGGGGYPPAGYNNGNGGYPPSSPYGGSGAGSYPLHSMSGGNNGPYPPGPGGFGMSPPPYGAGGPGMCTSPPQSGNPGMRPRPPPVSAGQRPPTGSQGAMGSQPSHPQQGRPINSSAPELGGGGPGARMSSTGSQVASSGTGSGPKPSAYRPSSNATITPTSGAPANNSANRGMYWTSMGSQDPQSGPQQQQHRQQHAVPPTAIRAGTYKEENFYVGRSRVSDGSMQVGMAMPSKGGLLIAYDGKANVYRSFEILCGVPSRAKWVQAKGRFDPSQAKSNTLRPIVCGSEKSGEPVYAATTTHKDREYGGRASAKVKGMAYVSKGSEEKAKNYYVLCETIE